MNKQRVLSIIKSYKEKGLRTCFCLLGPWGWTEIRRSDLRRISLIVVTSLSQLILLLLSNSAAVWSKEVSMPLCLLAGTTLAVEMWYSISGCLVPPLCHYLFQKYSASRERNEAWNGLAWEGSTRRNLQGWKYAFVGWDLEELWDILVALLRRNRSSNAAFSPWNKTKANNFKVKQETISSNNVKPK